MEAQRLLKKKEGEIAEGKLTGIYFDKVTFDELAGDVLTDKDKPHPLHTHVERVKYPVARKQAYPAKQDLFESVDNKPARLIPFKQAQNQQAKQF